MMIDDERRAICEGHVLAVVRLPGRPGEWVRCSCGWASPDVQFPTHAEAIKWARGEHGVPDD